MASVRIAVLVMLNHLYRKAKYVDAVDMRLGRLVCFLREGFSDVL